MQTEPNEVDLSHQITKLTTLEDEAHPSVLHSTSATQFFRPKKVEIFAIDIDRAKRPSSRTLFGVSTMRNTTQSFGLLSDKAPTKITEYSLYNLQQAQGKGALTSSAKRFSTGRTFTNLKSKGSISSPKPMFSSYDQPNYTFSNSDVSSPLHFSSLASTPMNRYPTFKKDRVIVTERLSVIGNEVTLPVVSKTPKTRMNSTSSNLMWPPKILRVDVMDPSQRKKTKAVEPLTYQTRAVNRKLGFGDCMKPVISNNSRAMFVGTEMFLKKSKAFKLG